MQVTSRLSKEMIWKKEKGKKSVKEQFLLLVAAAAAKHTHTFSLMQKERRETSSDK